MGSLLIALLLIGAVCWLWRDSLTARELAIRVCRRSCEAEGLQFLDDTVALASIHPVFPKGRPGLRRVYQFEFSREGNDRQHGTIILTGTRLETLYVPDRVDTKVAAGAERGVVIDLSERKRHH